MPFKSKAQMRKCYAMKAKGKAGSWDCEEWSDKTKNPKNLPESVKKAAISSHFSKIAKEMFDPRKAPPVPEKVKVQQAIEANKQDKMKGMTPVEYRNHLTMKRTGTIQRNRLTPSAQG